MTRLKKLRSLISYVFNHNYSGLIIVSLCTLLTTVVLTGVNPITTKLIFDKGIRAKNLNYFLTLSLAVAALYTIIRLLNMLVVFYNRKYKNKLIAYHTDRLFKQYFRMPFFRTKQRKPAYHASIIYDEAGRICNEATTNVISFISSLGGFFTSLSVALYFSWRVTLLLSLIVPLLLILAQFFSGKISRSSKDEKKFEAEYKEELVESLAAYKTVKIFDLHKQVESKTSLSLNKHLNTLFQRTKLETLFRTMARILFSYQEEAIILIAGYEVIQGRMSIGEFFAFGQSFAGIIEYFNSLSNHIPQFAKLNGFVSRLVEFDKDCNSEEQFNENHVITEDGYYKAENVHYSIDNKQIFTNLNLNIEKGKKTIITGENGCGKSTLIYLLSGFLKAEKGRILGESKVDFSFTSFPFNFIPGNMKDNVNYDVLTDEKKQVFIELTNEFGLAHKQEEIPSNFSSGEKQKLSIIMALLKDSSLYAFDEPTANLDQASKEIVLNRILESTVGKTLVCILHGEEQFVPHFDKLINLTQEQVC